MKEDNFESPEKEIDVKLVREIERFMRHLELRENTPPIPDEYIDDTTIYKIAQYFYELGQKDAASRFDEIEYNRQRAQEEMFDKGLDEAAEEYVQKGHLLPEAFLVIPTFKDGAKWQKEQMMKESVEHYVIGEIAGSPVGPAIVHYDENLNIGDKVRVIIVKEEEDK